MSDSEIKDLLRQLHRTLDGSGPLSEKDRDLLKQLSADIQAVLAQPGAHSAVRQQTILDRLQAAATRFEASHPDLTTAMVQVSKTLGDMGI